MAGTCAGAFFGAFPFVACAWPHLTRRPWLPHRCRYSTSTDDSYITDSTCAIHDYYIRENGRAVLLVVNTSLNVSSVPIRAFVSTPSQLLLRYVI